jgi:hypothetical protein
MQLRKYVPNITHMGQAVPQPGAGTCPWCHTVVVFSALFLTALPNGDIEDVRRCPNCQHDHYRYGQGQQTAQGMVFTTLLFQSPPSGHRDADASIPTPIAEDWREAHLCFGVGSYKGAAALARRAVQGVCIERGAKKDLLVKQIQALVGAGGLHPHLGDWATEVRILGNVGAHPGEDGLDQVSKEESSDILNFLDQMLDWTYVMPGKLDETRRRRQART